jgi:hypothetical protein
MLEYLYGTIVHFATSHLLSSIEGLKQKKNLFISYQPTKLPSRLPDMPSGHAHGFVELQARRY